MSGHFLRNRVEHSQGRELVGTRHVRRKLVAVKAHSTALLRGAKAPFFHCARLVSLPSCTQGTVGMYAHHLLSGDRVRRPAGEGKAVRTREEKRRKRCLEKGK